MKINLKVIGFYAFLISLLVSCEKDLYENIVKSAHNETQFHRINISELTNDYEFVKVYSRIGKLKVRNEGNVLSKTVLENQYGFTIIDSTVNLVDYGGKKSYSFLIKKDSLAFNKFQNLHVIIESPTSSKFTIIDYDKNIMTDWTNRETYDDVNMVDIAFDPSLTISTQQRLPCIMIMGYECSAKGRSGDCHGTDNNSSCYSTMTVDCGGGGSGGASAGAGGASGSGSGSGTSAGSGTGNSGGGGGSGDDIVVAPVIPYSAPNPCINLKKHLSLTEGVKLKALVPTLQPKLLNRFEHGNMLTKNPNGGFATPTTPMGTMGDIKFKVGGNVFGSVHTHPYPAGVGMFSWRDVSSLSTFHREATMLNKSECVIYLVCKDDYGVNQLYALKIENALALEEALNNEVNQQFSQNDLATLPLAQIEKKMDDLLTIEYRDKVLEGPEVAFLQRFSNHGIKLFKTNSSMTNWDSLSLDNTNPNVPKAKKTPCN